MDSYECLHIHQYMSYLWSLHDTQLEGNTTQLISKALMPTEVENSICWEIKSCVCTSRSSNTHSRNQISYFKINREPFWTLTKTTLVREPLDTLDTISGYEVSSKNIKNPNIKSWRTQVVTNSTKAWASLKFFVWR